MSSLQFRSRSYAAGMRTTACSQEVQTDETLRARSEFDAPADHRIDIDALSAASYGDAASSSSSSNVRSGIVWQPPQPQIPSPRPRFELVNIASERNSFSSIHLTFDHAGDSVDAERSVTSVATLENDIRLDMESLAGSTTASGAPAAVATHAGLRDRLAAKWSQIAAESPELFAAAARRLAKKSPELIGELGKLLLHGVKTVEGKDLDAASRAAWTIGLASGGGVCVVTSALLAAYFSAKQIPEGEENWRTSLQWSSRVCNILSGVVLAVEPLLAASNPAAVPTLLTGEIMMALGDLCDVARKRNTDAERIGHAGRALSIFVGCGSALIGKPIHLQALFTAFSGMLCVSKTMADAKKEVLGDLQDLEAQLSNEPEQTLIREFLRQQRLKLE